jgi:hypothetical protein
MNEARVPTKDEQVALRAHEIWEAEGRPDGRDKEHWAQAEREVQVVGDELPERLVPGEPPEPGPVPTATPKRRKPRAAG